MTWQLAAQGTNFDSLQTQIADRELPKGTKVLVEMDLIGPDWVNSAFDALGAESFFSGKVPSGMSLVDVYHNSGKGYALMEADPAFLLPVITFVAANWGAILITFLTFSVLLALAIAFVRIWAWVATAGPWEILSNPLVWAVVIGVGVVMLVRRR